MPRDYTKIVAWQRAHELTLAVYEGTKQFPVEERFGITSQLRRAAYSVAANIVEGSGRDTHKDYLRFLVMALASLKETEYFLLLARDLQYLEGDSHEKLVQLTDHAARPLQGLIKAVRTEAGFGHRLTRPVSTDHGPQTPPR